MTELFGRASGSAKRMTIQQALEWAFGREHARLDLDVADPENNRGAAVSVEWIIAQRAVLGCSVDGSVGGGWGGSSPAHDAEVIAAFVANLSIGLGGRSMAAAIASWARAGVTPDWMPEARVRCVPVTWKHGNQNGRDAATEQVGEVKYRHKGRLKRRPILACPVTYSPSAAQIAAARREYLRWYDALWNLREDLRGSRMLTKVELLDGMPPRAPWDRRG